MCPHTEHRCDVYAAGICSTRPQALCCKRAASRPHPLRLMPGSGRAFAPPAGRAARRCPAHCGSSRVRQGLRCGSCRSAARCPWWPFRPSPCAGRSPRFELRDGQLRASSTVGAAFGAREALLQHLQPLGLTAAQARGMQQFTGRQRRRHRNTTVDTHHAAITRTRDRLRDVGERDMPASGPIAGDPVGLHTLRDRPREAEAHPADLGHPHPTEPAVQTLDMMRFDADLPEPLVHTGFAPPRAAVRSAEKVAHRLREVPQRLLLHGVRASRQPVVLGARRVN